MKNFKNWSISAGQGVVQIKPNWVTIFAIDCLGKKLAFHTEIYDYLK